MDVFNSAAAIEWLKLLADTYNEKKDYLSDLDRAIGDSDHGINMSRGFTAVAEKITPLADKDLGTIFKTTAMTLISTVGGASGPLFGSFFLQMSMPVNGKFEATNDDILAMLEKGLASVVSKGKAEIGDKTMVDALTPAVKAFAEAKAEHLTVAVDKARQAARQGADSTKPLVAKKGRASYLGERSVDHIDPGSESTAILFDALYQVVSK